MFLGIAIGFVEFDRSVEITQPLFGSRQIIPGGRFPMDTEIHRPWIELTGFQNSFGKPSRGRFVLLVVVLNQADPIGRVLLSAPHQSLGLLDLAIINVRRRPQLTADSISFLQVDVDP